MQCLTRVIFIISREMFKRNSPLREQLKRLLVADLSLFQRIALACRTPEELIQQVGEFWTEEEQKEATRFHVVALDSVECKAEDAYVVYMLPGYLRMHPQFRAQHQYNGGSTSMGYAYRAMAIIKHQLGNPDLISAVADAEATQRLKRRHEKDELSSVEDVAPSEEGKNVKDSDFESSDEASDESSDDSTSRSKKRARAAPKAPKEFSYLQTVHTSSSQKLNELLNRHIDEFCKYNKLPSVKKSKAEQSQKKNDAAAKETGTTLKHSAELGRNTASAGASPETSNAGGAAAAQTTTDKGGGVAIPETLLHKRGRLQTTAQSSRSAKKSTFTVQVEEMDLNMTKPLFTIRDVDHYCATCKEKYFDKVLDPFVNVMLGCEPPPPVAELIMPEAFTHFVVYNDSDFSCLVRRAPPPPCHLCCIIGIASAYLPMFHSMGQQPRVLEGLKTMTLLKPSNDFPDAAR